MTVSAPTGTVTFLFSDIEGSTRRWEAYPQTMPAALERHDAILRDAIVRNEGHVFKTVGDAFCAVFSRAESALAAAAEAQRALAAEDFSAVDGLRVRIALHAGTTIERDDDYFGPTVNRVARLLALGHGGQTLLSGAAAALARDALPAGFTLVDLGDHALKDVHASERVFQLAETAAPASFPPLRGARPSSNLPLTLSSFVGRAADVAQVAKMLERARAVTLVGTGGIGKTRCALQVAARTAERFPGGVRLVELAAINDGDLVVPAIAAAFDVPLDSDDAALDTLVRALQRRAALVVLDNCEQIVAAAASVVQRLIGDCPEVTVLATSREPLGIRGESVYRLPSLALPPPAAALDAQSAARFDAVALFVERAAAARPGFRLDDGNVATVVAICRRLDGIALALELAATRLRALSPEDLLERLTQRFRLLKGGSRTDLPRQQTMRALVDWSYDLLAEPERAAFRALAVFPGRFDLDGALAIVAPPDADDAIDLFESLVDKSLVALDREELESERPYRLFETLREYAREKSEECGELDAAFGRLARRCLQRASASERRWSDAASGEWKRDAARELDDLRAVLTWSLERRRDAALGVELACASRRTWAALAPAEGRKWMLLARRSLPETATSRDAARVLLALAQMHVGLGQHASALEAARGAGAGLDAPGDEAERCEADMYAGFSLALLGDLTAAKPLLTRALATFERLGRDHLAAVAASDLAVAHVYAEEFDDARRLFKKALAHFARFDDANGIEAVTVNLSELEFRSGDAFAAVRHTADAIAMCAEEPSVLALANLAAYLCAIDRFEEARAYARESLTRADALGQEVDVVFSIQHLAAIGALEMTRNCESDAARFVPAARLLGYVDAALGALSSAREFTEQREYDRATVALFAALGRDALAAALRSGATLDERRAIAEALRL